VIDKTTRAIGIAWYLPEDYDAIRRIMADRDQIPDSFIEWRDKAQRFEEEKRREGHIVVRALIDPETFPDWCRSRGLNVDAQARMAYANFVAYKEHGSTH
jgi:hypothetical protein